LAARFANAARELRDRILTGGCPSAPVSAFTQVARWRKGWHKRIPAAPTTTPATESRDMTFPRNRTTGDITSRVISHTHRFQKTSASSLPVLL
jgi:hypothetical protein